MSLSRKIKYGLYFSLVEKIPEIQLAYQSFVDANLDCYRKHRRQSWKYLLALNIHYRYPRLKKKPEPPVLTPSGATGKKTLNIPEWTYQLRDSPVELSRKLLTYDVISFDVFDTLIFRPFDAPTDLFRLMALKINMPDFAKIRTEAEKAARSTAVNGEVNIYDIYNEIKNKYHIDVENAIQTEIDAEFDLCYGNEYIKTIFNILKYNQKEIIAVSDMYLPEDIIKKLLKKCGFKGFSRVYVSCDYRRSKATGKLYRFINKDFVKHKSVFHIGDDYTADCINARKTGWTAYHYPQCRAISKTFRPDNKTKSIASSVYRGIVANKIHNGTALIHPFDKYYEYGFIYGGIITCGFLDYLDDLCKSKNIDKILFLERGGETLSSLYRKHYNTVKCEYVLWSRALGNALTLEDGIPNHSAELYYRPFIKGVNNICVVDMDLSGLDIICFEKYITEKLNYNGTVTRATIYAYNKDSTALLTKMLFASEYPSILSFINDKNETGFEFLFETNVVENQKAVKNIQKGIKDYADIYYKIFEKYREYINISSTDAYLPLNHFGENKKWVETIQKPGLGNN